MVFARTNGLGLICIRFRGGSGQASDVARGVVQPQRERTNARHPRRVVGVGVGVGVGIGIGIVIVALCVRHAQTVARGGGDGAVNLHGFHAESYPRRANERVREKRGQRPGAQPHAQGSETSFFFRVVVSKKATLRNRRARRRHRRGGHRAHVLKPQRVWIVSKHIFLRKVFAEARVVRQALLDAVQPQRAPRAVLRDAHASQVRGPGGFENSRGGGHAQVVVVPRLRTRTRRPAARVIRRLRRRRLRRHGFDGDERERHPERGVRERRATRRGRGTRVRAYETAEGRREARIRALEEEDASGGNGATVIVRRVAKDSVVGGLVVVPRRRRVVLRRVRYVVASAIRVRDALSREKLARVEDAVVGAPPRVEAWQTPAARRDDARRRRKTDDVVRKQKTPSDDRRRKRRRGLFPGGFFV
mmetsp:Transcript_3429/g.13831  ORF Transcript_3429/g.13831 Transcript_3429/m.13831 type:complete len:418 (+) Transcript_3429:388-1641(+)